MRYIFGAVLATAACAGPAQTSQTVNAQPAPPPPLVTITLEGAVRDACIGGALKPSAEGIARCMQAVERGLIREGQQFSVSGTAGRRCWTYAKVSSAVRGACARIEEVLVRASMPPLVQHCSDQQIVYSTRPETIKGGRQRYDVGLLFIQRQFGGSCEFSAFQASAFATISLDDGLVMVRSDDFARMLIETINTSLSEL